MSYQIFTREAQANNPKHMLVLLPGRGQPATDMLARYSYQAFLEEFFMLAIDPDDEWYPIPNGAFDQKESIMGIQNEIPKLQEIIESLAFENKIDLNNIVLAGFSAGGVMAIQCAIHADTSYAAVVAHNAAILDTDAVPYNLNTTRFLVFHSQNDDCFSWEERYLPMKKALQNNNYNVYFREAEDGGHYMSGNDVFFAGEWLKFILGLSTNYSEYLGTNF